MNAKEHNKRLCVAAPISSVCVVGFTLVDGTTTQLEIVCALVLPVILIGLGKWIGRA